MSTYLDAILHRTQEDLDFQKRDTPLAALMDMPGYHAPRRPFELSLRRHSPAVIAEIKAASPSRGVIRANMDVVAIARSYVEAGAAALSVLTDVPFFQGRLEYMALARAGHTVPVLRKDFILDPYQVHQARAYQADAILLIVAALERSQLQDLNALADELGLGVLVEVHSEEELGALDGGNYPVVGINNRDLATFVTDMQTSVRLRALIGSDIVCVSESGIQTIEDMRSLRSHAIDAFLVGEGFMRAADPGAALRAMLAGVRENGA
jgi:indole-3-glycerol phosphate synthase